MTLSAKCTRRLGSMRFRQRFERSIEREEAIEKGQEPDDVKSKSKSEDDIGIETIISMELCRHSAGIVTAMGVSQLAAGAIMAQAPMPSVA